MRTKRDKIFDNKFDEIEQSSTPINFEIDSSYSSERDIDENLHNEMLFTIIEDLLINSKFKEYTVFDANKDDKISKPVINEVYSFVTSKISDYSKIEVFSMLSDYLDVAPTKFYNSLNNKAKDDLILELDKKTNVLERKGIKKLF
jgi:hypothetical protein